jgi:CMP/dCMP kinase
MYKLFSNTKRNGLGPGYQNKRSAGLYSRFNYLFLVYQQPHPRREKATKILATYFYRVAVGFLCVLTSFAQAQENKTWKTDALSLKGLLMNLRKIVIAIDGYSACGKSSTAKLVANILGYRYIDTGAMYRAVTLYFMEHHVALTNPKEISRSLQQINISFKINSKNISETFLNGLNVEKSIRSMRISERVSEVSAIKDVRMAMVEQQRKMGKEKGVVMDGRDIGTVVFPNAELKLFMSADLLVRAFRRQKELLEKDRMVDLDDVISNIVQRDQIDTTRIESPLRKAEDAILIDTTHITLDEQVDEVVRLALARVIPAS